MLSCSVFNYNLQKNSSILEKRDKTLKGLCLLAEVTIILFLGGFERIRILTTDA